MPNFTGPGFVHPEIQRLNVGTKNKVFKKTLLVVDRECLMDFWTKNSCLYLVFSYFQQINITIRDRDALMAVSMWFEGVLEGYFLTYMPISSSHNSGLFCLSFSTIFMFYCLNLLDRESVKIILVILQA